MAATSEPLPPEPPVSDDPVGALLDHLRVAPTATPDRFDGVAPDWFGERVFGGMVVGQALAAAMQTVDGPPPHSMHALFLGPQRPGSVDLRVERVRDGRSFVTREVRSYQGGRETLRALVSFHRPERGDEYELPMPDVPAPQTLPPDVDPPPLDMREIGPTTRRPDGTYEATRRAWARTVTPLGDDPADHLLVAAFLSDMTGASFRPHSLGTWGSHTDASLDHAVWFHAPCRMDDWVLTSFQAVHNRSGRATVRGEIFSAAGHLALTLAQELLIRPLT